jgi:hypothetical protein
MQKNRLPKSTRAIALFNVILCLSLAPLSVEAQSAEGLATNKVNRKSHKIVGWEKRLVNRSHNLSNYYWTPQTFYTQGSRRTGKGASLAGHSTSNAPRRYMRARFVPLPKNERINLTSDCGANKIQERCSSVISYDKNAVAIYSNYAEKPSLCQTLSAQAQLLRNQK